jgi:uncharacterized membrane-anchored protein YhcB (DUF1043 family)
MNTHTPKHFILQLGALLSLYVSITSLVLLVFSVINLSFPDVAAYWYESESARDIIRGSIATLVVFFPTYLILTRISNQTRRREMNGAYTTLGRWLVYLSLLVAGGVLLADLVTLILYFLNGEITTRFLLKVGALLLIVGAAFHYYLLDIRGYFTTRIQESLYFATGAVVVVIASILFGYSHIEAPSEVREQRIDQNQLTDLQDIQYRIEAHYAQNASLPESIAQAYQGMTTPEAPEGRARYTYEATGERSYELCAEFATESSREETLARGPFPEAANYDWTHGRGEWCFTREIIEPMP